MFLFRPKGDENFGQAGLDIHGLFKSIFIECELINLHFYMKCMSLPENSIHKENELQQVSMIVASMLYD
jgi:hypothetical protein